MKKASVFTIIIFLHLLVIPGIQQPVARAESSNSTSGIVLPEGYKSDDIVAVYYELKKKYGEKDEFETKEAYKKRMQEPYSQKRVSFLKDNEIVVAWDDYSLEYEAETQVMTIKRDSYRGGKKVRIKRASYKEGKYEGSNIFGAKVMVSSYSGRDYGIYALNSKELNKKVEINIPPDQAKDLKENFGVLFVCGLKKDNQKSYFKKEYTGVTPTYDLPISYDFSAKYICVDIVEIVFFNKKTGAVYARRGSAVEGGKG